LSATTLAAPSLRSAARPAASAGARLLEEVCGRSSVGAEVAEQLGRQLGGEHIDRDLLAEPSTAQ
jgi:hypothetical protein